jgi:transcriptional regulator with XRE-family HTH domain
MENSVKILRNRLGLSQHQFATLLGCSYSSVQNYEGGRKIPSPVLAKLQSIATKNGHPDLAALLASEDGQAPPAQASAKAQQTPERRRLHALLDLILDSGDPDSARAILPVLELAAKRPKKR